MARPIWTGSISFGMVAIPIRLVPAVRKKSISFNQLDDRNMARIRYRKVNEETEEEVPSEHIVKGYDLGGSNYVLLTDDDLAPLVAEEVEGDRPRDVRAGRRCRPDDVRLVVPDPAGQERQAVRVARRGDGRLRSRRHRSLRHAPEGVPGRDPLRRVAADAVDARVPRRARGPGLARGVRAARRHRGVRQGTEDGQGSRRRARATTSIPPSTPTSTGPRSRRSSRTRPPAASSSSRTPRSRRAPSSTSPRPSRPASRRPATPRVATRRSTSTAQTTRKRTAAKKAAAATGDRRGRRDPEEGPPRPQVRLTRFRSRGRRPGGPCRHAGRGRPGLGGRHRRSTRGTRPGRRARGGPTGTIPAAASAARRTGTHRSPSPAAPS